MEFLAIIMDSNFQYIGQIKLEAFCGNEIGKRSRCPSDTDCWIFV